MSKTKTYAKVLKQSFYGKLQRDKFNSHSETEVYIENKGYVQKKSKDVFPFF